MRIILDLKHYPQCLNDLEELVSAADPEKSAIIIADDFNAHLGTLVGPRGSGTPNPRGVLLKKFIDRNSLFVTSHSQLSSGPNFTYHSSSHFTTVDYIITNRLASEFTTRSECTEHSLNVSDHLALTLTLSLNPSSASHVDPPPKVDWNKAIQSGEITHYETAIRDAVLPLLGATNNSISELEDEILLVSSVVCHAAANLPKVTPRNKKRKDYFNDDHLKDLYHASKASWRSWKQAGRPQEGELLANMKQAKIKIQKYIQILRARRDRTQCERREERFRDKSNNRFRVPKMGTAHGQRLLVNGHIITDKEAVKEAWAQHFTRLSSSKASESPALSNLNSLIHSYRLASFHNEDFIFDHDITTEEINGIVKNLKRGKACGPDNILPA